jgi:hypothetical protein
MMCGDGARSWDSGRRADVVGGPWDASLVVPGVERRPRRGPDACSMAWRCGPRAARCGPRGRAGASRGRRARVPARGSRHTHCLTHTASPRSRRCRDAVAAAARGVHASRESGSRRWRRHETAPPRRCPTPSCSLFKAIPCRRWRTTRSCTACEVRSGPSRYASVDLSQIATSHRWRGVSSWNSRANCPTT